MLNAFYYGTMLLIVVLVVGYFANEAIKIIADNFDEEEA